MKRMYREHPVLLLVGDLLLFYVALWVTLLVRYFTLPDTELFISHVVPFTLLFVVWVVIFFIAGLYDRQTIVFRKELPRKIMTAHTINVIIAALFFFIVPLSLFEIAPKTNLFIYLIVSSLFILFWRLRLHSLFIGRKKQQALLMGSGEEMQELYHEVNENPHAPLHFTEMVDVQSLDDFAAFQKRIIDDVTGGRISFIIADFRDENFEPVLPLFYNLNFLHVPFYCIDIRTAYEDIFGRVPLSRLRYDWFLEHVSTIPRVGYSILKRMMDVSLSLVAGVVTLPLYPIIASAIKLDDGGPVFFSQVRIGKDNLPITIHKFRSMAVGENGRITRVGKILRKTRIDELPQLWSIVKGEQSLIGPRAELPDLAAQYAEAIPYYNVRHLIKPGLSGWGQINDYDVPRYEADIEKTKRKLSYDLYYIKHRSLFLDMHIALKTIGTILSRSGT